MDSTFPSSTSIVMPDLVAVGREGTLPPWVAVHDLQQSLPVEPAVFFLRNKGPEVRDWNWPASAAANESRFYRMVSSQGLIRVVDGRAVPPVAAESSFLLQKDGVPIDIVLERVCAVVDAP